MPEPFRCLKSEKIKAVHIFNDDKLLSPYIVYIMGENTSGGLATEATKGRESFVKKWILFIFRVARSLQRQIDRIDNKIERLALSMGGDTKAQYQKIIELGQMKVKLINLHVMYECAKNALKEDEYAMLVKYAYGERVQGIAEFASISRSTAYLRLARVAEKAARKIYGELNVDERYLEREYGSLPFIKKFRFFKADSSGISSGRTVQKNHNNNDGDA